MRLSIRGFIVVDFLQHAKETIGKLVEAWAKGKLTVSNDTENVVPTKFEDIPKSWLKLFEGGNTGKLITKII
jgi:NADPH-dependent curcumin reductase CurA